MNDDGEVGLPGKSAISGFYYQTVVGVLRLLEMLSDSGPYKISFEDVDKDAEDITLYWDDRIVYEQVKRRENALWYPADVRDVLEKFAQVYGIDGDAQARHFRFVTNSIPSPKTAQSDSFAREIKESKENSSLDASSPILDRMLPSCLAVDDRFAFIRRLDIVWAFCYSPDPRDPVLAIRTKCITKLKTLCQISEGQEDTLFQQLYELVSHLSSMVPGIATRAQIREILPTCMQAKLGLVLSHVYEPCRESLEYQNFDYLEENRIIVRNRTEIKVPIYAEKGVNRICIWFYGPSGAGAMTRFIEQATRNLDGFVHCVLLIEKTSPASLPVRLRNVSVSCYDKTGLARILEAGCCEC